MDYKKKYIKYKTKYNNLKSPFIPDSFRLTELLFLSDIFHDYGINPPKTLTGYQTGGGDRQFKWLDRGGLYTFNINIVNTDKDIRMSLLSKSEKECVTVFIEKQTGDAVLHNMSFFKDCAIEGLSKRGGGDILLRFILNHIIVNKDKLRVKRVLLKDNSFLPCSECSDTVQLSNFRIITRGDPWYTKYGFKPYDIKTKEMSDKLMKRLDENNSILDKIKTTEYNMLDIIKEAIKKEQLTVDFKDILIIAKRNKMLRGFVIDLSRNFDKHCCIIRYIIEELFHTKRILYDFHRINYYLNI
jgi:hypothetical protein